MGFAFKSNTNDTRYSPAITISNSLLENGAYLFIHDPQVSETQVASILGDKDLNGNINDGKWQFTQNLNDACNEADAIVILTEWEDYFEINWREISNMMRRPSWLFDTRGIVNEEYLNDLHLNVWKIGKGFLKKV